MNSTNSLVLSRLRRRRTVKGPARFVAVLVAVAVVASLSACGGEPVEYFTPPPSTPTPEVAASDEPEVFERPDVRLIHPPKKPNVMLDLSEESALAFAHYFVEVLNYTANSGDTSILEEISGPECDFCQYFIETTRSLEEQEYWLDTMNILFDGEPEVVVDDTVVYGFSVDARGNAYEVWSESGKIEDVPDQDLSNASLVIYRIGEYWVVEDFGRSATK